MINKRDEDCGGLCENITGYTHFAWNNFFVGQCWLKNRISITKYDAINKYHYLSVCGLSYAGK
jgi:hypothetical protein